MDMLCPLPQNCSSNFSVNGSVVAGDNDTFPEHLKFNGALLTGIFVYSVLFVIAAVGNLSVFISLLRSRHRKSRISLMIRHLALADLIVTFITIPLEIGWRVTVQWVAGNLACKVLLYLRVFGLYLSSNVLICVSLDRYFAVLHPLKVTDARRRGKYMLTCAWTMSLIYAIPQSFVFHVSPHPEYPRFQQCVTFGYFDSPAQEGAYNLFCVTVMYFVPLFVIIIAYTAITCEITSKTKDIKGGLRRSDMTNIERARSKTLRLTVIIVIVFVCCWTPYVFMTVWYMTDRKSAEKVPSWLQDALFMMAVSNSCVNPIVYGSYAVNFRKEFRSWLNSFRKHSFMGHSQEFNKIINNINTTPSSSATKINNLQKIVKEMGHVANFNNNINYDKRRTKYMKTFHSDPCEDSTKRKSSYLSEVTFAST